MVSLARNDKKKSPEQAELTAADDLESAYSGENGEEDFLSDGAFTLESILAEYKGSAYIEGDKRTPAEVLQQRTDRIIQEAGVGRFERGAPVEAPEESYGRGPARTPDDEKVKTGKLPSLYGNRGKLPKLDGNTARLLGTDTARLPKTDTAGLARKDTLRLPKTDTKRLPVLDTQRPPKGKPDAGVPDIGAVNRAKSLEYESAQIGRRESAVGNDVAARDAQLSPDAAEEEIIRDITAAIEQQTQFEQETQKAARKAFGIFRRKGYDAEDEGDETEYEPEYEAPEVIEDVYVEEPEPAAAIRRFAEKCNMYSTRFVASLAVSVLLAILTAVFQTGVKLPFGIGYNPGAASGILLILLFVVMMFSAEKLVDGVTDIIKGRQGIETLNLFSCLATASAAVYGMLTGSAEAGMPFCAVSAFSLTFTLWGERVYYRALTETLKTAHAAAVPRGSS